MTTLRPLSAGADYQPPEDGFVHIMPFGEYPIERPNPEDPNGDPIHFALVIDPGSAAAQIAAFDAERKAAGDSWGGMLVDFDHFSLDESQRSEAAGWATELVARSDGLYAKIRWSDAGIKAITGGTYRYTSPVHLPKDLVLVGDNRGRPMRLYRLALTNDPRMLKGDFRMRPISSRTVPVGSNPPGSAGQKGPQMETIRKALLLILALPETATDEELLQAAEVFGKEETAEEAHQEGTEAEESEEIKALKSRLETAEAELAGVKAEGTLKVLEGEGYKFTSRDQVKARLVADHDNTLAFIRLQPAPAAASGEPLRSRGTPPAGASVVDQGAAREEAIAAAQKKYGLRSRASAVTRAQKDHPELWK